MYVRDYMVTDVITISADAFIHDAQKLMSDHNIHRLPVVEHEKLVGILTQAKLRDYAPSPATSLSVWELHYVLAKVKVREVMEKRVITATPDMTVEDAASLGREHGVGALPVMEDGKLVGIVTTTDLFRILTEVLGDRKVGIRLHVHGPLQNQETMEVLAALHRHGMGVYSMFGATTRVGQRDLIVRLTAEDATPVVEELRAKGLRVEQTP